MVTFRLHLDDANEDNGCLKVTPKSHESGILAHAQIEELVNTRKPYNCEAETGDLLIMRHHLLHASSKSLNPDHRRVVHLEYSNYQLPKGLSWV